MKPGAKSKEFMKLKELRAAHYGHFLPVQPIMNLVANYALKKIDTDELTADSVDITAEKRGKSAALKATLRYGSPGELPAAYDDAMKISRMTGRDFVSIYGVPDLGIFGDEWEIKGEDLKYMIKEEIRVAKMAPVYASISVTSPEPSKAERALLRKYSKSFFPPFAGKNGKFRSFPFSDGNVSATPITVVSTWSKELDENKLMEFYDAIKTLEKPEYYTGSGPLVSPRVFGPTMHLRVMYPKTDGSGYVKAAYTYRPPV